MRRRRSQYKRVATLSVTILAVSAFVALAIPFRSPLASTISVVTGPAIAAWQDGALALGAGDLGPAPSQGSATASPSPGNPSSAPTPTDDATRAPPDPAATSPPDAPGNGRNATDPASPQAPPGDATSAPPAPSPTEPGDARPPTSEHPDPGVSGEPAEPTPAAPTPAGPSASPTAPSASPSPAAPTVDGQPPASPTGDAPPQPTPEPSAPAEPAPPSPTPSRTACPTLSPAHQTDSTDPPSVGPSPAPPAAEPSPPSCEPKLSTSDQTPGPPTPSGVESSRSAPPTREPTAAVESFVPLAGHRSIGLLRAVEIEPQAISADGSSMPPAAPVTVTMLAVAPGRPLPDRRAGWPTARLSPRAPISVPGLTGQQTVLAVEAVPHRRNTRLVVALLARNGVPLSVCGHRLTGAGPYRIALPPTVAEGRTWRIRLR